MHTPKRTWLLGIIAGICLTLSPFVVFVRYHGYSIWRPEILVCFAVLVVIGVVAGLLMESFGQYTRFLVFSFLITVTFDIQLTQPERTKLLWYIFAGSVLAAFLLRNHLTRAGGTILPVLLGISFFSATGPSVYNHRVVNNAEPANPSLPVFLHIILDGQIGVEGIPREFDEDGIYAEGLRNMYLDRGFRVYGRVFTRFFRTRDTMSKLFNFDTRDYWTKLHGDLSDGFFLSKNAYFDLMRERGYQIHVYQPDFAEYCGENAGEHGVVSCFTQGVGALSVIEGSSMSTVDKVRIVFGVYSRLSGILLDMRAPPARLWPISAAGMFDRVRKDVLDAAPGSMFVVHLLLPHSPYAYYADCRTRDDPWTWLDLGDSRPEGHKGSFVRNDRNSRAQRYAHYLEQVMCTNRKLDDFFQALEDARMLDKMEVLVHSDHGSRISVKLPDNDKYRTEISRQDYIDVFSSFFAYRKPGTRPSYDRRILPLGPLFRVLIQDGNIPSGVDWAGGRHVYYKGSRRPRPMPGFSRSLDDYAPSQ